MEASYTDFMLSESAAMSKISMCNMIQFMIFSTAFKDIMDLDGSMQPATFSPSQPG
jgi:hypothetical protein